MAAMQSTIAGPYGGFWLRVVARIIDTVIIAIALGVIEFVSRGVLDDYDTPGEEGFWTLVWFVGHWLYFASLHASEWQATLGKRVVGLRVTNLQGQRISFGRATGRYFAEILSALILLIGYLMVAFTERKQGLHDMLASTLVVRADGRLVTGSQADRHEAAYRPSVPMSSASASGESPHHWTDAPSPSVQPSEQEPSKSDHGGRSWVFAGFSESGEVQRLVVQEADFAEAGGELVLGRSPDRCHLVVPDMTVSGVHGWLRLTATGLEVADMDSTNGTAVNGVMVPRGTWRRLQDGDLVAIGGAELRVFLSDG